MRDIYILPYTCLKVFIYLHINYLKDCRKHVELYSFDILTFFSRYPETLTGNLNLSPNPGEGNVNPNLSQRNQNNPFILPQEPNLPYLLHKNVNALDRRIPESSEETRHEVESVESRGSKVESEGSRGSRKSDMGTSTDLSAPGKIFRLWLYHFNTSGFVSDLTSKLLKQNFISFNPIPARVLNNQDTLGGGGSSCPLQIPCLMSKK